MKKIFALIVFMTMSVALPMQAQWRYGIRLGGEFSGATCDKSLGFNMKGGSGFAGGLTLEWQLPKTGFAVGTAVLYERRNIYAFDTPVPNVSEETGLKMGGDFLALPIDFRYKFYITVAKQLVAFYPLTGPEFAVRLNKADSKRFHMGWNVGAGLDIVSFIQIQGGYRFGLNDISNYGWKVKDSGGFFAVIIQFAM